MHSNSLHFEVEKFYESSEDSVLVEEDHVLAALIETFGIGLAFEPTAWNKRKKMFIWNRLFFKL